MTQRRWLLPVGMTLGILLAFAAGLLVGFRLGQPPFRLSPMGTALLEAEGHRVEIIYSRPYVRTREIFGEVVPYDRVWRTGANEATALFTDGPLRIGDESIPAGEYTLYTIPRRDGWTLIVNRQTGQWGTVYDSDQDLARIEMQSEQIDELVEQFTIRFATSDEGWALVFEWERTRASVPLRLD